MHRGLAFENALLDASMMIEQFPDANYLLGGVDEISTYNFNIDLLDGWYKKEKISNKELYSSDSPGSIAGEGAAMFLVSNRRAGAVAHLDVLKTLHTDDVNEVIHELKQFTVGNTVGKIDLLLSGENGDNRLLKYYEACEAVVDDDIPVARFKHMSGEYPTAASFSLWLACYILEGQRVPVHMFKKTGQRNGYNNILIYNNYKGKQHSFLLVSNVQ